jgi:hypothetical protein
MLRESLGVQFRANFDGACFNKGYIMIGDVEGHAVRKANAKRPEWLSVHALSKQMCGYHPSSLSIPAGISSRELGGRTTEFFASVAGRRCCAAFESGQSGSSALPGSEEICPAPELSCPAAQSRYTAASHTYTDAQYDY